MNLPLILGLFLVLFLWVGILTFFSLKYFLFYLRLMRSGKKESLSHILNEIVTNESENKKALEMLTAKCDKLEKDGALHIQKVGLVRFNPFKDTGGDQSFILALVDAEDTGVVISSLHTRTGTRWYAKRVIKGKGVEYALSDEECKALKGSKILS